MGEAWALAGVSPPLLLAAPLALGQAERPGSSLKDYMYLREGSSASLATNILQEF